MAGPIKTPGVYVEAVSSIPGIIAAVPTSVTAFVGRCSDGPVNVASKIGNWSDFARIFGGLAHDLPLTYAVRQFYENGGGEAWIVRLKEGETAPGAPWLSDVTIIGDPAAGTGLFALDAAEQINLLCIPPDGRMLPGVPADRQELSPAVRRAAVDYCVRRRAFFIMDPPVAWNDRLRRNDVRAIGLADLGCWSADDAPPETMRHAAVYTPTVQCVDPLRNGDLCDFAPSGAVAGVFCATDVARGVWKAPAGITCGLAGVEALTVTMNDDQNGSLNPCGINSLRNLPLYGPVIWGARTLVGADGLSSEYQYVPVTRLALFIEQSVRAGTQWTVFEPNDERLWATLRSSIGQFLHNLVLQGAAYDQFVQCDATTTSPIDVANGVANIIVGIAPAKPAEFVTLSIQVATASPVQG